MRAFIWCVLCGGGLLLAAACGGSDAATPPDAGTGGGDGGVGEAPRLVEIIATEFDYNPERIYVTPGQPLIIRLRNEGAVPHGIELDLPTGQRSLATRVPPNETAELRITAPTAPGAYPFTSPDRDGDGMRGQLIVVEPTRVGLREITAGLTSPVALAVAPDGSGRRFVVDQTGQIWIVTAAGERLERPFLDLSDRIVELNPGYDERGLLGLAFHPEFARNGRFYVYYSAPPRAEAPDGFDHTTHVSELRVSGDPDLADPASERVVLQVDQPQSNHNAGTLAFGPDGYLYISLGDGGGAGDDDLGHTPGIGNGQDRTNLLGSLLRIDPMNGDPYRIPPDNPFVDDAGADEIFAYGFRNPYRFSFDPKGGARPYVADAGQELWEEVSLVHRGGNYGWRRLEGTHCFDPGSPERSPRECRDTGAFDERLRWPIVELPNLEQEGGLGNAIVGGFVYRGAALPELDGRYVFGVLTSEMDAAAGALWTAALVPSDRHDLWAIRPVATDATPAGHLGHYLKGFGQGPDGEIYVLTSDELGPTGDTGQVWLLVPPATSGADPASPG